MRKKVRMTLELPANWQRDSADLSSLRGPNFSFDIFRRLFSSLSSLPPSPPHLFTSMPAPTEECVYVCVCLSVCVCVCVCIVCIEYAKYVVYLHRPVSLSLSLSLGSLQRSSSARLRGKVLSSNLQFNRKSGF